MENIDKMTMELLMNRTKYSKYIAKTDPKKYDDQQKEADKIRKYANRIASLTEELLEDPHKHMQGDINESFMNYVKTCIYHFETKDYEQKDMKDSYEHDDEDGEDTMFGDNCNDDSNNNNDNKDETHDRRGSSYWGKSITKMNAAMSMDAYIYSTKNKKI